MVQPEVRHLVCAWLMLFGGVAAAEENPLGRTKTGDVGDALEYIMPATAAVAAAVHRDWQGARQYVWGAVSTLAVTHALKDAIDKERPDGRSNDSFPSGHTAIATHAAMHLRRRYGWKWGFPALVAASYVGYSRVYDDRHFEEDVLAGALIGAVSAELFTREFEGGLRVSAALRPGFYGFTARMQLP